MKCFHPNFKYQPDIKLPVSSIKFLTPASQNINFLFTRNIHFNSLGLTVMFHALYLNLHHNYPATLLWKRKKSLSIERTDQKNETQMNVLITSEEKKKLLFFGDLPLTINIICKNKFESFSLWSTLNPSSILATGVNLNLRSCHLL